MCWCDHLTVTNHWQVATALVCHGCQSAVCVDEGHRSNSVGVSATEHGVVAAARKEDMQARSTRIITD